MFLSKKYDDAAQHILNALQLQQADSTYESEQTNNTDRGITSTALWDSLKTCCLHMERLDLGEMCDRRDLDGKYIFLQFTRSN